MIPNVKPFKNYISKNKITKTAFCKMCGLSIYQLNKLLTKKLDLPLEEVMRIAKIMQTPAYKLIAKTPRPKMYPTSNTYV